MSKLFSCDYLIKVWQNVTEMWVLKRFILSLQEEYLMDFDYYQEYLSSISNKILFWQC